MNKLIKFTAKPQTSWFESLGWAMNGLRTVWSEETNFRIQICVSFAVVAGAVYLKFSVPEWIIITGCIGAVFSAEMLNTAIEDLCNKVEPARDQAIGKIKDIMGGFVLLVCLTSIAIGLVFFSNYL